MKALIKVVTAAKFSDDQEQILKRISNVLVEHHFSVSIVRKVKKVQTIRLKVV